MPPFLACCCCIESPPGFGLESARTLRWRYRRRSESPKLSLCKQKAQPEAAPSSYTSHYFCFLKDPCGLTIAGATNMCVRIAADDDAVGFCRTNVPTATWVLSVSMNGKFVPSTV